jgi:hypothetical protein
MRGIVFPKNYDGIPSSPMAVSSTSWGSSIMIQVPNAVTERLPP